MSSRHTTVLLKETIQGLNLPDRPTVLDCTFGGGGHSLEICKNFPGAKLVGIDQDRSVFERVKEKFVASDCNLAFITANFREIKSMSFPNGSIDGVIFDLGLSSDQLESSGRGFSFIGTEPLLMTMKENPSPEDLTAREIVNTWEEKNIADVIYGWGGERYAKRIAKAIAEARKQKHIETTRELVKVIEGAVPAAYRRGRIHPATRTFQALRIAVNDELGAIREGLEGAFQKLKSGGRMAVISFHSLEDRIVKNFYKDRVKEGSAILINKKPIIPGAEEIQENPRSRSAKLRILSRI